MRFRLDFPENSVHQLTKYDKVLRKKKKKEEKKMKSPKKNAYFNSLYQ